MTFQIPTSDSELISADGFINPYWYQFFSNITVEFGDGVTSVALGGTGATDALNARFNLGLEIGVNIQAYSEVLQNTTASFTIDDELKLDSLVSGSYNFWSYTVDGGGSEAITTNKTLDFISGDGITIVNGIKSVTVNVDPSLLTFVEDVSAVNHIEIENEETGSGPIIRAAGSDVDIDLNIKAKGDGNVLFNGFDAIFGDPGLEGSGVNIHGVIYDAAAKVSDLGGAKQAQFILHRHSETLPPVIISARSHSNDSSHSIVLDNDLLFGVFGAGWSGAHYDLGASITFEVDGTPGADDMPGRIVFSTTPDGAFVPVEAGRFNSSQQLKLANDLELTEGGTGASTASDARTNLDVDVAGTDNSTNVSLAGTPNYITIVGQIITRALINLTSHITGILPLANGGTGDAAVTSANIGHLKAMDQDVGTDDDVLFECLRVGDATVFSDTKASLTGDAVSVGDRAGIIRLRGKSGDSIVQLNVKGNDFEIGGGGTLDTTPVYTIDTGTGISKQSGTGTITSEVESTGDFEARYRLTNVHSSWDAKVDNSDGAYRISEVGVASWFEIKLSSGNARFYSTTDATSATSDSALRSSGGASIAKSIHGGGDLTINSGGEVFLNLPAVSTGTSGSLWNDSGTVKVVP